MSDPTTTAPRGLKPLRVRCSHCKSWFCPSPRLKQRQKTCGKAICQRAYRASYRRQYRRKNPGPDREYEVKATTSRPKIFWKNYRKEHPASTQRNRDAARLRKRLLRAGLQRQLDIVQVIDPPGYFDDFHRFATSHRSLLAVFRTTHAD
jgi:hypothetical protein